MLKEFDHQMEMNVRDYECDLQGIVNNAVYLHYFEHARHELLHSKGVDFAAMHELGKDLVLIRAEIDYKYPLKSRDRFVVRTRVTKEGRLKMVFEQEIYRMPDEKLIVKGKAAGVCLVKGKPSISEEIEQAFFR